MLLFIDGNCPGTVFRGEQSDMDWLNENGGSAMLCGPAVSFDRPAGAAEACAMVRELGGLEERLPPNLWERRDCAKR